MVYLLGGLLLITATGWYVDDGIFLQLRGGTINAL